MQLRKNIFPTPEQMQQLCDATVTESRELRECRVTACKRYTKIYANMSAAQKLSHEWQHVKMSNIHVPTTELEGGAMICDLRDFAKLHPIAFKKHLQSFDQQQATLCEALINAVWNRGVVIYVPRDVQLQKPIELQSVISSDETLLVEKIVVIVEDDGQITVVDDQGECANKIKFSSVHVTLGNRSTLDYVTLLSGGESVNASVTIDMPGERARAYLRVIGLLEERKQLNLVTLQRHRGEKSVSDVQFKTVLRDSACLRYDGMIRIAETADGASAGQENKNILLSDAALVTTVPCLEILNNNVRCNHGSATGYLDKEHLFYAQSRGLSNADAQCLLLHGFLADSVPANLNKSFACRLQKRVVDWVSR